MTYLNQLADLETQLESMLPADKLAAFRKDAAAMANAYKAPLNLNKGDLAPDFTLPNADGTPVNLTDLLKNGPVVMVFYRGIWCPYCNLALKTYQQALSAIKENGANLVAISPMTPDNSLDIKQTNELDFYVLSDKGNTVAKQFTSIVKNPTASLQAMTDLGYDFFSFYDDGSTELPIPAAFVIDTDGTVIFAQSEGGDYRQRTDSDDILQALANIQLVKERA